MGFQLPEEGNPRDRVVLGGLEGRMVQGLGTPRDLR